MSEADAEFLAEQGWLSAEVDEFDREVRHVPPRASGEADVAHPLDRIRDCPACRRLGVEPVDD